MEKKKPKEKKRKAAHRPQQKRGADIDFLSIRMRTDRETFSDEVTDSCLNPK